MHSMLLHIVKHFDRSIAAGHGAKQACALDCVLKKHLRQDLSLHEQSHPSGRSCLQSPPVHCLAAAADASVAETLSKPASPCQRRGSKQPPGPASRQAQSCVRDFDEEPPTRCPQAFAMLI